MSNTATDGPRPAARPRRNRQLVIGGLLALFLLVGIGLVYYWIDWHNARQDRRDQSSGGYQNAHHAFLQDIEADRLDPAYRSTTASFQRRVSRAAFEERVHRYLAFTRRPGARGIEGGASGPTGGDYRGPNQMTFTGTWEDGVGSRLQMSITVVQEDSILHRRPPPPRVGEFTVEEVPPRAPGKP
jgi:hypothetical protein